MNILVVTPASLIGNFYKELIKETGIEPGWNFHKYLIGRDGKVSSFNTKVEPNSSELISSIKSLL